MTATALFEYGNSYHAYTTNHLPRHGHDQAACAPLSLLKNVTSAHTAGTIKELQVSCPKTGRLREFGAREFGVGS